MGLEEALKLLRTGHSLDHNTKVIVLLLSNTRGTHINGLVMKELQRGVSRDAIKHEQLEEMLLTPHKVTQIILKIKQ